jgi:hypothetical protein
MVSTSPQALVGFLSLEPAVKQCATRHWQDSTLRLAMVHATSRSGNSLCAHMVFLWMECVVACVLGVYPDM